MSQPKRCRINAIFHEGDWNTLDALARETGKSKSEVLRDAVALEKWFWRVRGEGGRVLVEMKGGMLKEVVPR